MPDTLLPRLCVPVIGSMLPRAPLASGPTHAALAGSQVHRVTLGEALHYFLTGPDNWTLGEIPQAGPAQRTSMFYVDA